MDFFNTSKKKLDIKNDNMLIQSFRKGRVNAIPYLFSFEM